MTSQRNKFDRVNILGTIGLALVPLAIALVVTCLISVIVRAKTPSVVVYTSQDEEFAEPIFKDFEKETGITVKPVFDSEAVKTVGLVNRLLAEKSHPQCDVFWNNEELRTRMLASRGMFRETNGWALLGYRTRRVVVNTNLLPVARAPRNFSDVTNVVWRGKVALAYPLFGTTGAQFLALRQLWGDERWQAWCRALTANKAMLVDGNSVVVKLVGNGEAMLGFTDSDDIAGAQREGLPVAALPMNDETLLVHNSAGILRGAPHSAEAQKLFEYLQSKAVSDRLLREQAIESAAIDTPGVPGLKVDWDAVLRDMNAGTKEMDKLFLR
jgi:iron(III) transport system substrate-binding protein